MTFDRDRDRDCDRDVRARGGIGIGDVGGWEFYLPTPVTYRYLPTYRLHPLDPPS